MRPNTASDKAGRVAPLPTDPSMGAAGLSRPTRFGQGSPGTQPGIDLAQLARMPAGAAVHVSCIDYGRDRHEIQSVANLEEFVARHRPAWATVRWINVDGLSEPAVIRTLAMKYRLHPLAIEDLLSASQRPKLDLFEADGELQARLFLIVQMVQLAEGRLLSEQISIFLGHSTVLTFQCTPGDVWEPIRQRIAREGSAIRRQDASYLLYALLDAIVDHCFPVLERYGDLLERLEDAVLDRPEKGTIQEIHDLKQKLLLLRRAVWPLRDVVSALQREPHECVSDTSRLYLRDAYEHIIQIMDIIETYRETATSLTETYMISMSNRLSEVMKVLTVIGTIFIPLTFLAGVYGMNMPIPENEYASSYPIFWGICTVLAASMLVGFRRRGWL